MPRSFSKPHIPGGVRKRGPTKDWIAVTGVTKVWPAGKGGTTTTAADSVVAEATKCTISKIIVSYAAALAVCVIYEQDGTTVAYQFVIESGANSPYDISVNIELAGGFACQTTSASGLFNLEFEYK